MTHRFRSRRLLVESAARAHVDALSRAAGAACPQCGRSGLRFVCRQHGRFSPLAGSMLERSHVPLHKWLLAIRLMIADQGKTTASQLHQRLELGSFHTAQRMRECVYEQWRITRENILDEELKPDWYDDDGVLGANLDELLFRREGTALHRPIIVGDFFIDQRPSAPTTWDLDAAVAYLELPLEEVIALGRYEPAAHIFTHLNDMLVTKQHLIIRHAALLREIVRRGMIDSLLSRAVQRPLPTPVFHTLRRNYKRFATTRASRADIYVFLHCAWLIMKDAYSTKNAADRAFRLNRKGIQSALFESTPYSADRCHRYARAIMFAATDPAYDGTLYSFIAKLRIAGGIDRASRMFASRKR